MHNFWRNLNPRERRLAIGVVCLLAIGVATTVAKRASDRLRDLDGTIQQSQSILIEYTQLVARSQSVDEAYRRIASQHSSAWSEAEIHDRIRQEVYRQAMRTPPPEGVPFSPSDSEELVSIPTLQQGTLRTDPRGFREYQLNLAIPPAPVENLFAFLERLQGSAQSLRIDRLELFRDPMLEDVTAIIDITRTVVDDLPADGGSGENAGAARWPGNGEARGVSVPAPENVETPEAPATAPENGEAGAVPAATLENQGAASDVYDDSSTEKSPG